MLPEEVGAYYVVCRADHVVQAAPSPQGRCLNLRRWTAGPRTKLETISNLDTTKYGFLKVSDAESAAPALNHLVLAAENPDSNPLTANRFTKKKVTLGPDKYHYLEVQLSRRETEDLSQMTACAFKWVKAKKSC